MDILVDLKVAELLCSRLCHELVNPVGAVSNGVELIAEFEGGPDPEALALIAQSARSASQRLQFYRLAYGQSTGASSDLTFAEIGALVSGPLETARLRVEWPQAGREGQWRPGRTVLKLLLNLALLAAEALPRGGRVQLELAFKGDRAEVAVKAAGEQVGLSSEIMAAFRGKLSVEDLTARLAHAYFTGRLSEREELPVALEETSEFLAFRLSLPVQG